MNWLKSIGTIRCHNDHWLVIHTCEDMGRDYRRMYNWANRFSSNGELKDTKWGPHISVVRGEIPSIPTFWNLFHDTQAEFEYLPSFRTNGKHVWFPVQCHRYGEIRKGLGLSPYPFQRADFYGVHLTIGTYHRQSNDDMTQLIIPPDLVEEIN